MMQKYLRNDWNPGTWVLIWEYSVRAIQWISTWQGLDGETLSAKENRQAAEGLEMPELL